MTIAFCHPAMRCVLKHMEAVKRIQLATHWPEIRNFDKSIPLQIETLSFENGEILINDQEFEIQENSENIPEEVFPGDIMTCLNPQNYSHQFLELRIGQLFETSRFPDGLKLHQAQKLLACTLFGGRSNILVNFLKIDISKNRVLRLPEGVKFSVRNLDTGSEHLEHFLPIIDSESQLKNLTTKIVLPGTLDLPMLKNSESLEILGYDSLLYSQLANLTNRKVMISNSSLPKNEIFRLIDNWVDFGKEIGTEITLDCEDYDFAVDVLKEVKEIFGGSSVHCEADERCTTFIVSIPMHPSSELIIYGIEHDFESFIKMEVVPEGFTYNAPMTRLISLEEAQSRITVVEMIEKKKKKKKSHAKNALRAVMCGFKI